MDDRDSTIIARLDLLTDLVERRLTDLEARVTGIEKDIGRILELVSTLKDNLESACDELAAEDDDDPDDDDAEYEIHFVH